jgi:hypothetical protein
MNIAIIDGVMGSGKTLAMSILSAYFQQLSACTLFSNYELNNSKKFTHYRDFLEVALQPSSIIDLDEAHTDLDGRNFNTNVVKFFTHLIFYFRKLRTTIFLATPSIDNLDTRVRANCQLYIRCSKDKINFYYDIFDMQSGRFLKRFKIKRDIAYQLSSNLYDTHNMVHPVLFPADRIEFNMFLEELIATSDNYYKAQRLASSGGVLTTPLARDETVAEKLLFTV